MAQRLQKIISLKCGLSRRKAEDMIRQGRVLINGEKAEIGMSCEDNDVIAVDGQLLGQSPELVYVALYKPLGYVTTMSDQMSRKSVSDLLRDIPQRVYPCGRLDMYSEGLIICTNDGQTANRITHPSHEVWKEYILKLRVANEEDDPVEMLTRPMIMDGRKLAPVKCRLCAREGKNAVIVISIREGRNRQIRRMCAECGFTVTSLKRVSEGEIKLGDMKPGTWRYLTEQEIAYLKRL